VPKIASLNGKGLEAAQDAPRGDLASRFSPVENFLPTGGNSTAVGEVRPRHGQMIRSNAAEH